jgi:hypothetical protein
VFGGLNRVGEVAQVRTQACARARTEGYNRIVKHVGRIVFSFRNPADQPAPYGGPAPADHGQSHPAGANATANCEEPLEQEEPRVSRPLVKNRADHVLSQA